MELRSRHLDVELAFLPEQLEDRGPPLRPVHASNVAREPPAPLATRAPSPQRGSHAVFYAGGRGRETAVTFPVAIRARLRKDSLPGA